MSVNVSFSWGNLPANYCFSTLEAYKNDIFNLLTGNIGGNFNGVIISTTTPAVGDRDKLWVKIDSTGRPLGNFIYLGSWIWPHPTPASGGERRMYAGTNDAAGLWAYDGGDGTDPAGATPTTGSMWAVDHDFDFAIPMGPGTNPLTYDGGAATVLAEGGVAGATLGAEKGLIDKTELPPIQLGILNTGGASGYLQSVHSTGTPAATGEGLGESGVVTQNTALTDFLNNPQGGGTSVAQKHHSNLPPVRGIWFIKRSARMYYVGA